MNKEHIDVPIKCEMFKTGISHWGNKALKRCKRTAIKTLNGKDLCINCYNLKIEKGGI
jgi:hypothetical protein